MSAMATPGKTTPLVQATKRSEIKAFNPNKSYPVRLSERLTNRNKESTYTNASIQLDPSIKFGPTAIAASIESDPLDPDTIQLNVNHRDQPDTTTYQGTIADAPSNRYTLTFDQAAQALILDKVDTTITVSAPKTASPLHDQAASVESDSESIGSPDPLNPFDWRHQFRKRKSSSPEAPALSEHESPMPVPKRHVARKASTPPGSIPRSAASSPAVGGSDFEIEIDGAPEPPRKRNARIREESIEAGSGDDLVLELEAPARGRPKALSAVFGNNRGRQPRSLASRSGSRQPNVKNKQAPDEDGFEIDLENSPPPEEHEHEHDDVRSDLDVSEMEVGSPVHPAREPSADSENQQAEDDVDIVIEEEPDPEPGNVPTTHPAAQQPPATEQEEENNDEDMMEAFEEVFEQMEGGDDDQGVAAVAGDGYESEEVSEAE